MLLSWGENKNKLEAEAVSSSDSDGKDLLCCLPVAPELRKRDTEASEQPGKCLRQPTRLIPRLSDPFPTKDSLQMENRGADYRFGYQVAL